MRQVAALPYRYVNGRDGSVEVLLVTSSAGRWIIPKGDIDEGMARHRAAEKEAFEEGGVRGRIGPLSLGTFHTCKQQDGAAIPAEVDVFPLEVTAELASWPEMAKRERRWLPVAVAATAVGEADLADIIRSLED